MKRALWALASVCVGLVWSGCPQFEETSDTTTDANTQTTSTTSLPPGDGAFLVRECVPTLVFDGAPGATSVTVAGEFNAWNETSLPMTRKDGRWSVAVEDLPPGHYAYKYVVDGKYEERVPPEVYTKWSGGTENRNLVVEDCSVPAWQLQGHEITATGDITATLRFVSGTSLDLVDPKSVKITLGGKPVEAKIDQKTGTVTIQTTLPAFGKHSLRAWGTDTASRVTQQNPLWVPLWHEEKEFVWQDATMYLIFTDRFLDADGSMPLPPIPGVPPIANYMGGDFLGILQKIEDGYFQRLGINLLWLSPIYENTDAAWQGSNPDELFGGFHGYWPIDPLQAETRYGDAQASADERLKQLIDAAHAKGMRVLFDVVHNHVHQDHVYCKENPQWCATTGVCGSPGWDWEGPNGRPIECQFASYLPDLDYKNHDILRRQIEDTLTLGERFDIDGFRVDAAKHMNHIIMRTLRLRLNDLEAQGAAPFYAVGETYTGGNDEAYGLIMEYVADHELHGQFDFPLLYPIRDTFARGGSFRSLEDGVVRSEQRYGEAYTWMSPFLGNHDIERFVTHALQNDGDKWDSSLDVMNEASAGAINDTQWDVINRMSMGFAFLLTQPGIPLVYYGDEIGLAGSGDPDNRRMMIWAHTAAQKELLGRVQTIGRARQDLEPLRRGSRTQLWVDDTLYVYARHGAPGDAVLVAMNKGGARTVEVTIPPELGLAGKSLTSVNSAREVTVNGTTMTVSLDPWEYAIFKVK